MTAVVIIFGESRVMLTLEASVADSSRYPESCLADRTPEKCSDTGQVKCLLLGADGAVGELPAH